MTLSTGQQAALFTIALILAGVGALGTTNTLGQFGLPPITGFVFLLAGIISAGIIKGYGLSQQTSLALQLSAAKSNTPSTTKL